MDATIKYLSHATSVVLVVFCRYTLGTGLALLIWNHAKRPTITAEMLRVHALRGFVMMCSGLSFFWALTVLPLAEAVTLTFIYPLIVPFAATAMIGEPVR